MLLVIAFKVILLSLLLLTVLVPVRMRMFAAFESVAAERSRPFSQHRAIGLLAPLARFLDGIVIPVAEGAQVRARKDLAAALPANHPSSTSITRLTHNLGVFEEHFIINSQNAQNLVLRLQPPPTVHQSPSKLAHCSARNDR